VDHGSYTDNGGAVHTEKVMGGLGHQILIEGDSPEITQGIENMDPTVGSAVQVYPCDAACGHVSYTVEDARQHRKNHSMAEVILKEQV